MCPNYVIILYFSVSLNLLEGKSGRHRLQIVCVAYFVVLPTCKRCLLYGANYSLPEFALSGVFPWVTVRCRWPVPTVSDGGCLTAKPCELAGGVCSPVQSPSSGFFPVLWLCFLALGVGLSEPCFWSAKQFSMSMRSRSLLRRRLN